MDQRKRGAKKRNHLSTEYKLIFYLLTFTNSPSNALKLYHSLYNKLADVTD